ncbi:MAG: hypothetical protein CM15mP121_1180 [Bacteroidota bacterium]|nr:MAG: hypothetical protein CM15mP121_1180 [Bacteroidota bacterium]
MGNFDVTLNIDKDYVLLLLDICKTRINWHGYAPLDENVVHGDKILGISLLQMFTILAGLLILISFTILKVPDGPDLHFFYEESVLI